MIISRPNRADAAKQRQLFEQYARVVDALLDTRPNRLDEAFRAQLLRRTQGHALFTIELLRELQARGDLVQDAEGRWMAAPNLAWDVLPARVEAVIARRIGRLNDDLQALLRAASMEGETFTAQVLAQVQGWTSARCCASCRTHLPSATVWCANGKKSK